MLELLSGARRNVRPLQLHFVAHSTGALWLNRLLARITETRVLGRESVEPVEARRQAIATIDLLAPICSPGSFRTAIKALWGSSARRTVTGESAPVAIYTLAEEDDAADRVGAFEGSFLELARRAFPIDGALPERDSGRCAVLGYATEARTLGRRRTDLTRFVVRNPPIRATCRSHRGLASNVQVLTYFLNRIRESAPDTAAAQLDLPESALLSLSGGTS